MSTSDTSTEQMTITLPHELAAMVRAKVAAGEFASESDFFESKLVESILQPVDEDGLVEWMNTEGVRRLEAMKADPSSALSHDEFWAQIEADELAEGPRNVSS